MQSVSIGPTPIKATTIGYSEEELFSPQIRELFEHQNDSEEVVIRIVNELRQEMATGGKCTSATMRQRLRNGVFLDAQNWDNHCSCIIKDIRNISFPLLRILYLQNNQIESAELLQRISMPLLQNLELSGNCLTDIKSIRKMDARKLINLSLADNPIAEFNALCELNSLMLNWIHVKWMKENDISIGHLWIAKLDLTKLKTIVLQGKNGIRERGLKVIRANLISTRA